MKETTSDQKKNAIDQSFSLFIQTYKYELIASFSLISMLAGIVLAVMVFKSDPAPVEFVDSSEGSSQGNDQHVIVDIAGAVEMPGVYELSYGGRIRDALDLAGGISNEANGEWVAENINQAEIAVDGQKVYIPFQRPEDNEGSSGEGKYVEDGNPSKININQASILELVSLPGIGDSYAKNIINGRPYGSIQELMRVSGIGSKRFDQIKDMITVY